MQVFSKIINITTLLTLRFNLEKTSFPFVRVSKKQWNHPGFNKGLFAGSILHLLSRTEVAKRCLLKKEKNAANCQVF